ncbi:MAG: endonuclease/exonuclease/phosphatase family protein, partial [Parvularculaceae bacterium]
MQQSSPAGLILALACFLAACGGGAGGEDPKSAADKPKVVRIATFNAALNRPAPGALIEEAAAGESPQIRAVAEIIQRVNPDIILINEIDRDEVGQAAALFKAYFLARSQNGAAPIDFPHVYFAPVNTGVPSGFDLNRDGAVHAQPGDRGYGEDAFGFGAFQGQYGMAVLSKYPFDPADARTFQNFLWKDMPGALLPDDPQSGATGGWYAPAALEAFRLSSKSHWDLPVRIGSDVIHILASHPTPPAFDGPEARNRRRNHDEIRLWADYISKEKS